jgi:predicted enzyme related to lactoylglutathione lyase
MSNHSHEADGIAMRGDGFEVVMTCKNGRLAAMIQARIESICLTAFKCDKMAVFYAKVFGISFRSKKAAGHKIYSGKMADIDFVLVPAVLNRVTTKENKVHFDIYVDDIGKVMKKLKGSGGKSNERLVEDDTIKCIGVFDPDGNFMAVKQRK